MTPLTTLLMCAFWFAWIAHFCSPVLEHME